MHDAWSHGSQVRGHRAGGGGGSEAPSAGSSISPGCCALTGPSVVPQWSSLRGLEESCSFSDSSLSPWSWRSLHPLNPSPSSPLRLVPLGARRWMRFPGEEFVARPRIPASSAARTCVVVVVAADLRQMATDRRTATFCTELHHFPTFQSAACSSSMFRRRRCGYFPPRPFPAFRHTRGGGVVVTLFTNV